jgi:hypothetical protein
MANRMRAITLPVVSPAVSLSRRMSEAQPVNIKGIVAGKSRIQSAKDAGYSKSTAEKNRMRFSSSRWSGVRLRMPSNARG